MININEPKNKISFIKIVRVLMIVILFPTINIITQTYQACVHIKDVNYSHQEKLDNFNKTKWVFVSTIINENKEKAKLQANNLKDRIQARLLEEYENDFDTLQNDLFSKKESKASRILNQELSGKYSNVSNDNNDMFIAILKRTVNTGATKNYTINSPYGVWEGEVISHSNRHLPNKCIKLIITRSKSLIFWNEPNNESKLEKFTNPSMYLLRDLYMVNGFDSLRGYNFLVPSFVQRDKNVFDIPNTNVLSVMNDDVKLVVFQELNVVETIERDHEFVIEYFEHAKDLIEKDRFHRISKITMELFMNLSLLIASFIGIVLATKIVIDRGEDHDGGRGSKD